MASSFPAIRSAGQPGTQEAGSADDIGFTSVEKTGPGTLAGTYLRTFWQPVLHSHELKINQARSLRILGQNLTIYRGASGQVHIVGARCPHRAVPLGLGRVEGEELRCFYHGWKYNGAGQCTDQPAERPNFCAKIKTESHPARDYIGLIFAYLGEGQAPELPRYPSFEAEDAVLTYDSYERACNYFNNLENLADFSHIPYAHAGMMGTWDEHSDGPSITATESVWGVSARAVRPSGKEILTQFGMPNIGHVQALPDDPLVSYREFLSWWVPVDDDRHIQFTVVKSKRVPGVTEGYLERRAARWAKRDVDREQLARDILAGRKRYDEVDPERVNLVFLQDDLSQMGVGMPSERPQEHLGRADAAVVLQRRLWIRELKKLRRGEPLKAWRYDPELVPARAIY